MPSSQRKHQDRKGRLANGRLQCHCANGHEPLVGAAKRNLDLGPTSPRPPEEARLFLVLQPALHARARVLPKISTDREATSRSRLLPSARAFPLLHSIPLMTSRSLPRSWFAVVLVTPTSTVTNNKSHCRYIDLCIRMDVWASVSGGHRDCELLTSG